MAFDITKFQKKYKEVTEQNKVLQERIAGWEAAKAAEIESAKLAVVTPLRNQVSELQAELTHESQVARAAVTRADELESIVKQQRLTMVQQGEAYETLKIKYDAARPAVELAESKVTDLLAELKKHEDRMAEKHRREIAAIANRKLVAGAVPGSRRP